MQVYPNKEKFMTVEGYHVLKNFNDFKSLIYDAFCREYNCYYNIQGDCRYIHLEHMESPSPICDSKHNTVKCAIQHCIFNTNNKCQYNLEEETKDHPTCQYGCNTGE